MSTAPAIAPGITLSTEWISTRPALAAATRLRSKRIRICWPNSAHTGNTTAEYGRNSGGQVALVTKSGTNELHGTGFWFYRTPRLNANEFENNWRRSAKGNWCRTSTAAASADRSEEQDFFFANVQAWRAWRAPSSTAPSSRPRRDRIFRYVNGGAPAVRRGGRVGGRVRQCASRRERGILQHRPERSATILGLDPTISAAVNQAPPPNNFALATA